MKRQDVRSGNIKIRKIFAIIIGSALFAAGFRYFMYPNNIVAGGVTGIAMIINKITGLPIGMMIISINIPLFYLAWRRFGLRFVASSLFGILLPSIFMDVFAPAALTHDRLLASVYGGAVMGLGLGLVFSAGATTGGADIAAKLIQSRFRHINLANALLLLDALVIGAFAIIFGDYDSAMFATIGVFIVSRVIDFVLLGAADSKLCCIITKAETEPLIRAITVRLDRGATILEGKGAYTGQAKGVILCAVYRNQIPRLQDIVHEYDASAFMIICDAREIFGNGFMSLKV